MDTCSDGKRIQCSKHLANADLPVVCLSINSQAYVSLMKSGELRQVRAKQYKDCLLLW